MKKHLTIFLIFFSLSTLLAQDPSIIWQRTIGGSETEMLPSIMETNDGGILLAGTSNSNISGEKSENSRGGDDFWILKLDNSGIIEWQKTIGGSGNDNLTAITKTADGGYLIGGTSNSPISGEKTEPSRGMSDYWFLKIDENGTIVWQKTLGGADVDSLRNIRETVDGGYIVYGHSRSQISGDKTLPLHGVVDLWLIKLNSDRTILWQKSYGFAGNSEFYSIDFDITENGSYMMSANYNPFQPGDAFYFLQVNNTGSIIWEKYYQGDQTDITPFLSSTAEGNFIAAGTSESDASLDKTENSQGSFDYWVLELNPNGAISWQNTIGGLGGEQPWSVMQTIDGGYLIAGNSDSPISGDKIEDSKGGSDYWIVKLNNVGIIEWQNTIGGIGTDHHARIIEGVNGDLYVCGASSSDISSDKSENSRGLSDFWLLKLDSTLSLIQNNSFASAITLFPNPTNNTLHINTHDQSIDQINIYTITGNRLIHIEIDSISPEIDVSSLATGVYYVQLFSQGNVTLKKFIKG